jgi:hypothetical protein
MDWRELIVDGYERLPPLMAEVLAGLGPAELDREPAPGCNTLGWTAWHLTRVQDSQIADLMGAEQLWTAGGWSRRFGRPPDPDDSGYGHTPAQVRAFRSPTARVQLAYLRATVRRTLGYLASVTPAELDRTLDEPWYRPRPTVGVRLLSILADCHQHAGEASYVRGLLKAARRRPGRAPGAAARAARRRPARGGRGTPRRGG